MKRLFISLIIATMGYCMALAQDDIKRPDSYNYQKGVEAYTAEDYSTSDEFFDKELEQNPKNGYAYIWKAFIYDVFELYGKATDYINKGISLLPKKDKSWIGTGYGKLAEIEAELGDTLKAMADYDKAYKIDKDPKHIYSRIEILHDQGKYADIDTELKRIIKTEENSPLLWRYRGWNENAKGNYDKALDYYAYSIKLNHQYSAAYSFRADTYMTLHKYKEACQDAIYALSIDGDPKAYCEF